MEFLDIKDGDKNKMYMNLALLVSIAVISKVITWASTLPKNLSIICEHCKSNACTNALCVFFSR